MMPSNVSTTSTTTAPKNSVPERELRPSISSLISWGVFSRISGR